MKKADIISIEDILPSGLKQLPKRTFYEDGFSYDNLPKLFRFTRRLSKGWKGVRACCPSSDGIRHAKASLKGFKDDILGQYPGLIIVRSGWDSPSSHYCQEFSGTILDGKRSCHGNISAAGFIDVKRTAEVDDIIELLQSKEVQ